jgi:hypothetical protein
MMARRNGIFYQAEVKTVMKCFLRQLKGKLEKKQE